MPDQHPMTALIVDDARIVQRIAGDFLKKLKFEVLLAPNGYEGLKIAMASKPDLILLDIMMPRLDGLKTLQVLKSNELTKSIPVIVMTAHSDRINVLSAAKLGAEAVLTKPLSEGGLMEKIGRVFGDEFIRKSISSDPRLKENPFGVNEEEYADTLRPLVEDFMKYFSDLVDELSIAVRDKDVSSIKRITHDIKGTVGPFGYDDASRLATRLCEVVSANTTDGNSSANWEEGRYLLLQLKNRLKS